MSTGTKENGMYTHKIRQGDCEEWYPNRACRSVAGTVRKMGIWRRYKIREVLEHRRLFICAVENGWRV